MPLKKVQRSGLFDGCGRRIDQLRLSVTSACDLRCTYCRPAVDASDGGNTPSLTDQQRVDFIRFLHEHFGLAQVRFTGGEPLRYRGITSLVANVRRTVPDVELAMTTNGRLLYHKGFELQQAGLDRLNVSVDTLHPERYRRITGGQLGAVLEGLKSARFVGFPPPKINTVVLRGINDDEITELARWAISSGSEIRFLEVMPIGPVADVNRRAFVPASEIRSRLAEDFSLEPLPAEPGATARRYRASGPTCSGVVGVIAPVSEPFCADCRRIRLTTDGHLFPCLLDSRSVHLEKVWCNGSFCSETAESLVQLAVGRKRPTGPSRQVRTMVTLGG